MPRIREAAPRVEARGPGRERDVLLALGYYDYRFHLGVSRYAREHGWHLVADMAYRHRVPTGWRGDGIIAKLSGHDELEEFVLRTKTPVVNVGRGVDERIPRVLIDDVRLVQMAVEHFVGRGFEHFAWFGSETPDFRRTWPSDGMAARSELYAEAVRKTGAECLLLDWDKARGKRSDSWLAERRWLVGRLQALPKPVAVFCIDDAQAAAVIRACVTAGIAVPEEVAVLGVNNDELVCESVPIPISSIDTDMEGRAYRGAALLAELMDGGRVPLQTLIPPKCLMTRRSSDILAIRHAGLAKALRFIWERTHEPISVTDVARAAAMSTRGLHKAFVANLGRPPHEEIQRVRMEKAKRLLRETGEKTESIASDAGYETAKNLFRAFRRQLKMTPTQYRRMHQKSGGMRIAT